MIYFISIISFLISRKKHDIASVYPINHSRVIPDIFNLDTIITFIYIKVLVEKDIEVFFIHYTNTHYYLQSFLAAKRTNVFIKKRITGPSPDL